MSSPPRQPPSRRPADNPPEKAARKRHRLARISQEGRSWGGCPFLSVPFRHGQGNVQHQGRHLTIELPEHWDRL